MSEPGRSVTLRMPSTGLLRGLIGVLVAAALVAGSVVAGVRTHDLESKSKRIDEGLSYVRGVLNVARGYAITFATYRYDDLDADFAATAAHSVNPFLTQYRDLTAQIRPGLQKARSSSTAKIVSAGVSSITLTSAVVELLLNQTITNKKGTRTVAQRVEMTLVRRDNHWLISNVVLP
jgi:hypothetical protein